MTDPAKLNEILEGSPEQVGKHLKEYRTKARIAERVFAVQYLKYKHGEGTNYSIEDAKEMARASDAYDEAKAEEITAEASYRFQQERMINARKEIELLAKGL